jgi:hypothetical protein
MGERDLTLGEVRAFLDDYSDLPDETPVRLAHQPSWPFEYALINPVVVPDVPPREDRPMDDLGPEAVVYLVEGAQTRYLPGQVADHIGWGDR